MPKHDHPQLGTTIGVDVKLRTAVSGGPSRVWIEPHIDDAQLTEEGIHGLISVLESAATALQALQTVTPTADDNAAGHDWTDDSGEETVADVPPPPAVGPGPKHTPSGAVGGQGRS